MTDTPAPNPAWIQVLIMDDSRSARFALGKFLESLGCSVTSVGDLNAALAYLDHKAAGLMFLEHDPADVGFGALHSVKQHIGGRMMPVVLCLSDELPGFDTQAFAQGAAAIMIKPPTRDGLAELLTGLVPGLALPDDLDTGTAGTAPPAPAFPMPAAAETRSETLAPSSPAAAPAGDMEARLQQLEARLGLLEQNVERGLMELRVQLDLGLQAQAARIDQSREAIRAMVTEEAQAVAERTVMGAAAKISDRLAESILKTLGRGQP